MSIFMKAFHDSKVMEFDNSMELCVQLKRPMSQMLVQIAAAILVARASGSSSIIESCSLLSLSPVRHLVLCMLW